jgi:hypothetical protein
VTSPHSKLELVVRPTAAVAHAAAHFTAPASDRLRFREHFDPCSFLLELYDLDPHPAHTVLVIAWPDRDGSRLEIVQSRSREFLALFVASTAIVALMAPLFGAFGLLLLPLYGIVLNLLMDAPNRRRHAELDREVLAALERAFAPLRRTGLPYREPAPLPEPDPPDPPTHAREQVHADETRP